MCSAGISKYQLITVAWANRIKSMVLRNILTTTDTNLDTETKEVKGLKANKSSMCEIKTIRKCQREDLDLFCNNLFNLVKWVLVFRPLSYLLHHTRFSFTLLHFIIPNVHAYRSMTTFCRFDLEKRKFGKKDRWNNFWS